MDGFLGIARAELERLRRYVERRVATVEESQDILQDVFLAAWQRHNLGEAIHDVAAWLFRAAGHKIVDTYRRRSRAAVGLGAPDANDLWELADASVATPDEEIERSELRTALARAINELPAPQREVFLLHEVEGVPFREIEARTGVPLNTLLSRKRYAVLRLRETLRPATGKEKGHE